MTIVLVIDPDAAEARRVLMAIKHALHGVAQVSIVTANGERDAIEFLDAVASRETRVPVREGEPTGRRETAR